MYRRAAAQGPLRGVEAGPYTGGIRVVDAGMLPRTTKQRLADVLRGRSEPSLIAYERSWMLGSPVRSVWGAVLGVIVLVTTFATGLDHEGHAWEVQPRAAFFVYALACALFARSLLAVMRRRSLAGGSTLSPGRYLLPLDVVEIAAVDAHGRQLLTIHPLGDARDASVRGEALRTELVVTWSDGSRTAFPLRGDPGGAVALRRLEHAQRLLEDLTYEDGLERRLANDPFFELRIDGSWSAAAPPSLRTQRSLAGRRRGTLVAGAAAAVLAFATFGARNWIGAKLIVAREQTRAAEERLARARAERDAAREREAEEAKGATAGASPHDAASCLEAIRKHATPRHPGALVKLEEFLRDGAGVVPVVFQRTAFDPLVDAESWRSRERVFVRAFERVFSELCPASVLELQLRDPPQKGLVVRYEVSWPDEPWNVPRRGGGTIAIQRMHVVFDVTFQKRESEAPEAFRLTLPPPDRPSMALRPMSIFVSDLVDDGTFDERAYDAMSARAFDRLYDEVWSLFFDGDPRVPLRADPREGGF